MTPEQRNARTLTDSQRLLWRDDVEGICSDPNLCFEFGKTARCGPCAVKQSRAAGVEPDWSLPSLPAVARLRRMVKELGGDDGNG